MSQAGIKTKDEILEIGIEAFNAKCRESVLKYTSEWEDYVTRQARWVDFEGDYKTLNVTFMESVLWAFKSLYDKGLVYEGFRVLPYCWNDQTPLSNHEPADGRRGLPGAPGPGGHRRRAAAAGEQPDEVLDGALALVWTTTPWTLPANLAVMVGEDIEYVVVRAALPAPARVRPTSATCSPRSGSRHTGTSLGRSRRSWPRTPARRRRGAPTCRRSPTTRAGSARTASWSPSS